MEEKTNKKKETVVEIIENGPLVITGNFIFADLKRNTEETGDEVRICRCGKSKNMPFCDNSHEKE